MFQNNEAEAKTKSPPDVIELDPKVKFVNPYKGYRYTPWMGKKSKENICWTKEKPKAEAVSIIINQSLNLESIYSDKY